MSDTASPLSSPPTDMPSGSAAPAEAAAAASAPSFAPSLVPDGLTEYSGGCHCGAVSFRLHIAPDEHQVLDCNCSICTKKGFLHLIVTPDRFNLLSGQEQLQLYTFQTHTAKHFFCRVCGISSFYRPRSHPEDYSVNLRCLDHFDAVRDRFRVLSFDGSNWEAAREKLAQEELEKKAIDELGS